MIVFYSLLVFSFCWCGFFSIGFFVILCLNICFGFIVIQISVTRCLLLYHYFWQIYLLCPFVLFTQSCQNKWNFMQFLYKWGCKASYKIWLIQIWQLFLIHLSVWYCHWLLKNITQIKALVVNCVNRLGHDKSILWKKKQLKNQMHSGTSTEKNLSKCIASPQIEFVLIQIVRICNRTRVVKLSIRRLYWYLSYI